MELTVSATGITITRHTGLTSSVELHIPAKLIYGFKKQRNEKVYVKWDQLTILDCSAYSIYNGVAVTPTAIQIMSDLVTITS